MADGTRSRTSRFFSGKDPPKNEVFEHEWTSLKSLWAASKRGNAAIPPAAIEEIDALLKQERGSFAEDDKWDVLNDAELRVAPYLSVAQLAVEFRRLLAAARASRVPFLSEHEANLQLFDAPEPDIEKQRAGYDSLLKDVQAAYVQGRLRRKLKREVALRLLLCGLGAVLLAGASLWLASAVALFSRPPIFPLALVAAFGILGAYFSRVMRFQSNLETLEFEEVMNLYIGRMIFLRMLYGMIGAIILYLLIHSGFIEGELLPDLSALSLCDRSDSTVPAADAPANLAKLLIWSFLAGFSERLIPDRLELAEGRSRPSEQ